MSNGNSFNGSSTYGYGNTTVLLPWWMDAVRYGRQWGSSQR